MSKALRAIVVQVSNAKEKGRIRDVRGAWRVANALIKTREKVEHNVCVLDILYSAPLECYVFIYERVRNEPRVRLGRRGVHRKNE